MNDFDYVGELEKAMIQHEEEERRKCNKVFLESLTETERLKIVYFPLILTQVVFEYVSTICGICIKEKLPYKQQVRNLKELISEYNFRNFTRLEDDCMNTLYDNVDSFFDDAGDNIDTLFYVIMQELKKRYRDMDDYNLPTYLYVTISLIDYTLSFMYKADKVVEEKTRYCLSPSDVAPELYKIKNILSGMTDGYKIKKTDMIELAIKIISNKVNTAELNFVK